MRRRPLTLLEQFDAPDMVPNCLARTQSTVATQALELFNSSFVREQAGAFARRILQEDANSPESRLERVFLHAYARRPQPDEQHTALDSLTTFKTAWSTELARARGDPKEAERLAWEAFCHSVLNSPEFIYID
jgi:hypothetical protein